MVRAKNRIFKDDVLIKFVKRANMWCKTYWNEQGEQIHVWTHEEPDKSRPETI